MKWKIWKRDAAGQSPGTAPAATVGELLADRRRGPSVRYGHLEMVPLFDAPTTTVTFAAPMDALRLTQVTHYGKMVLDNSSDRIAIVPLHMGYFQAGAQNHAMCRAGLLGPRQSHEYTDACCIQAAQGGYITESDERFIVLPHPLRARAFALRGKEDYSKLWGDITSFNQSLGLKNRGHLDELKRTHQPDLLRTTYHLEAHPGQTGAVFLHDDTIVGIELAPDPAFYAQLHVPLVMYCYAPLRLLSERRGDPPYSGITPDFTGVRNVADLRGAMERVQCLRAERLADLHAHLQRMPLSVHDEASCGGALLHTVEGGGFRGQAVTTDGKTAYASLFAG